MWGDPQAINPRIFPAGWKVFTGTVSSLGIVPSYEQGSGCMWSVDGNHWVRRELQSRLSATIFVYNDHRDGDDG